jgi:hypothetical protein
MNWKNKISSVSSFGEQLPFRTLSRSDWEISTLRIVKDNNDKNSNLNNQQRNISNLIKE